MTYASPLDMRGQSWYFVDMTTKQISLIKHLATGHYGHILDTCIDGSIALRGDDADLARKILNVLENGRYVDRISNHTVSQMIGMLQNFPPPENN